MHVQNLVEFQHFFFISKVLSGNKINNQGPSLRCVFANNCCNNSKQDQVNVNASAKFAHIPSIPSQDREPKRSFDDNWVP